MQTLAGSDGEFLSAGNLLLTSQPGNPGPPPAPPGVVIKINRIDGKLLDPGGAPVILLTDAKIFGYDPRPGRCTDSASTWSTRAGRRTTRTSRRSRCPARRPRSACRWDATGPARSAPQVLLVATGSSISVYNATTGAALGSFATPAGFNSLASTDTITVAGNVSPRISSR